MNASLRQSPDLSLLVNYGEPVETAKTEPAKNKELTWRELGDCMGYVRFACSLGLKEYAARLGRKYQQVSDMIEGKERPVRAEAKSAAKQRERDAEFEANRRLKEKRHAR